VGRVEADAAQRGEGGWQQRSHMEAMCVWQPPVMREGEAEVLFHLPSLNFCTGLQLN